MHPTKLKRLHSTMAYIGLLLFLFSLVSCDGQHLISTPTPYPTYTLYPTYTVEPSPTETITPSEETKERFVGFWDCYQEHFEHLYRPRETFNLFDGGVGERQLFPDGSDYGLGINQLAYEVLSEDKITIFIIFGHEQASESTYTFRFDETGNMILREPGIEITCKLLGPPIDNDASICTNWRDAIEFLDEEKCVEGIVSSVYDNGDAFFINFDNGDTSYYGVSFDYEWNNDTVGRCVRINGIVSLYNGRPQTIINNPEQIEYCD